MNKRQSIKGKGAEIFTGGETTPAHQLTSKPVKSQTGKTGKPVKATFYLTRNAVNEIEDVWMDIRRADRKLGISKSDIVSSVLEKTLGDLKNEPKDKLIGFFKSG